MKGTRSSKKGPHEEDEPQTLAEAVIRYPRAASESRTEADRLPKEIEPTFQSQEMPGAQQNKRED
jgi:hypothetical protein